jgi:hypothetical protein
MLDIREEKDEEEEAGTGVIHKETNSSLNEQNDVIRGRVIIQSRHRRRKMYFETHS